MSRPVYWTSRPFKETGKARVWSCGAVEALAEVLAGGDHDELLVRRGALDLPSHRTGRAGGAAEGAEVDRAQPRGSRCCHARALLDGGGGIRTHEALARPTVFKTAPFDRSGTPPKRIVTDAYERISAGAP